MNGSTDIGQHAFWLASRASGVVALVMLSLSVIFGLALSGKMSEKPGSRLPLTVIHEVGALVAIAAIAAHGLLLLGDKFLKPGISGIALPFSMSYRPGWTGLGIIAGYLAVFLGPTFYLRRWIGAKTWRSMHRFILVAWLLATLHTIGAGTDASSLWLRVIVYGGAAIVATLTIARLLPAASGRREGSRPRTPRVREADEPRSPDPAFAPRPHPAARVHADRAQPAHLVAAEALPRQARAPRS